MTGSARRAQALDGFFHPHDMKIIGLAGLLSIAMVVLAGCSEPPAPASAPKPVDRLGQITARGELRVRSTGDYRPFTYHQPGTSTWSGIDVDRSTHHLQRGGCDDGVRSEQRDDAEGECGQCHRVQPIKGELPEGLDQQQDQPDRHAGDG